MAPFTEAADLQERLFDRSAWATLVIPWRRLIAALLVVILFVPMRRYTLPGDLAFELEPYRVLVAFLVLGWLASLLVDPRVRARRSELEAPLLLILAAMLLSIAINSGQITSAGVESDVLKSVMFFFSFVLVFCLIVSVTQTLEEVDFILKVLVAGGAIVGALAVYEWRTGNNVFDDLRTIFPFLEFNVLPDRAENITGFTRGDRLRTYASAEHPIALGAALIMLVPLALYLARRTRRRYWWLAALLLSLGAFATISRTFVIMAVVIVLVFVVLRPRQTLRLWPAVIPLLLTVHFALPNTLGILKSSLFPSGGASALIAEQQSDDPNTPRGRIAKIAPTFEKISRDPLFGVGYGSQVLDSRDVKALILDNQWLGTLLETGIVGALAWVWLFGRFLRRLGRAANQDESDRGWLLTAITASVAAFAVSMLFYDAFAFVQVTFLLFVLLSFGAVLVRPAASAQAKPD